MTLYAGTETILPGDLPARQEQDIICVALPAEREETLALLLPGLSPGAANEDPAAVGTRLESRHGYDYLSLDVPDPENLPGPLHHLEFYFKNNLLLMVGSGTQALEKWTSLLNQGMGESAARALLLFFSCLFNGDSAFLQDLEEEIMQMEDLATQEQPPKECIRLIGQMRKKLLVLKRYYEALFDMLEDMEENQNGFLSAEQLRSLHIYTNRADRLVNAVIGLREYVTQVREAYQNQIDLSLNGTMKLFTVLTAIFFPLTLIAGWYGMNLRMPEYQHPYAYPMVILLSILVIIGSIWIFRRKKWF